MPFNFDQWKESTKQNLQGWKVRMDRAGVNSAYYLITASAFLPIVEAAHKGDWSALAVLGSAVGTNLLANIVQQVKDKSDVELARILEDEVGRMPELKAEMDAMLQKLDTLQEAEKALSEADKAWFAETIQRELKSLNSGIKYKAKVIGDGAIAQGDGAKAVGAGGIMVEGGVSGNGVTIGNHNTVVLNSAPDPKQIEADKNETLRRAYLERMRRHCQTLPLGVLGVEDGSGEEITLDQVYVDLDTDLSIREKDLEELRIGNWAQLMDMPNLKETSEPQDEVTGKKEKSLPLSLWDAVRATSRVVILGDPGAGKSTFARKMLGLQAAVMLKQCEPLPGFAVDLLPVLIVLRELTANLDGGKIESLAAEKKRKELLAHIHRHLANDLKSTSAESSTVLLQQALESGKVLLVLDGLDEVPQAQRKTVRQMVGALLSEYQVERLVITSRIRSYVGNAVFEKVQTFTIRPFAQAKIRGFVKAWYHTQAKMGHVLERDLQTRIQDLSKAAISENLREISSNPMMLTSMAIIHQKEIGLPRERVLLYKLVVDVLLRRWQKNKLGKGQLSLELDAFLMDDRRLLDAMERLAYEAHLAGSQKEGSADLPRMRALEILEQKEYLNNIGLAGEFLDYVDQRSGLLKGNGGELEKPTSYSFPHRTFQEYLAGCYMVRDRNPAREYYQRAAEGDAWSLAALLGAEELFFNRRGKHTVLDLAYGLMREGPASEQDARAILWSGQVARVASEEDFKADKGGQNDGEKYLAALPTRLLMLLQSGLSPIERAEAGRLLGILGDPREEVMTVEKMVFCRVPAGEFIMGDEKEEDNKPRKVFLPEFFISQHPITNAQFDYFVKAEGYKEEKYWAEAQKAGYWNADGFQGRYEKERRIKPSDEGIPFNYANHPVVGVSWYEALAFGRWLEEQIKSAGLLNIFGEVAPMQPKADWQITLPSEAEWEKAARGLEARTYPWGEEFSPNFVNAADTGIKTTSALGCFPKGVSPYGLHDMSGNVWEWTRTNYETGKDNFDSKDDRVLRGGSFGNDARDVRCAIRLRYNPDLRYRCYGFRVIVMVSPLLS